MVELTLFYPKWKILTDFKAIILKTTITKFSENFNLATAKSKESRVKIGRLDSIYNKIIIIFIIFIILTFNNGDGSKYVETCEIKFI